MRSSGRDLGRLGESAAQQYLKSQGLRTIARNVRTRYGEVDLVCRMAGELVFVEVKTRLEGASVGPLDAVSPTKAARLIRLAEAYVAAQEEPEVSWRIDVVTVVVDRNEKVISIAHLAHAVTGS